MRGVPLKSLLAPSAFKDTLNTCGLFDLAYSGHQSTWWNGQGEEGLVEEWLDHFCTNFDQSALFSDAVVNHIDDDFSDHLPIFLLAFESHSKHKVNCRKCFENFWALEEQCEHVVYNAWMHASHNEPIYHYMEKIRRCMNDLVTWNMNTFGHLQQEIKLRNNALKQVLEPSIQQQLPVRFRLRGVWEDPQVGSLTLVSITTHKEADSKDPQKF